MNKTLLFTLDFPPDIGGVASYYQEICQNLPDDKIVVLAPRKERTSSTMSSRNFFAKKISGIYGVIDSRLRGNDNRECGNDNRENEFSYKIYRRNLITNLPIWPKSILSFWHLWRIIRKEKIKTVLIGQILPLGSIALFLSKILKFEYGVFIHGLDILNAQKKIKNKILAQKVLDKAKFVISNSLFTAKELEKFGVNSEKITIVYPCPFNVPPAKESARDELVKKYNLKDKKIILSLGRLVKRKGFDMLIKAMPKILEQEKNLVYILAGGKGNYEKEIQEMIENSPVKENIILIKDSSNDKARVLFDLCNIFAMPSRQIGEDVEGFGIVFLEANSFGKSVIGGKSGGVTEAIIHGETGFLVNPTSEEEISEKIIRLLKDEELAKKLGKAGRERVGEEFTWGKQVQKLESIL